MAVEKRQYKNRTTYRAYWRNPYTQKIERGPARDSLKEAKKDDAEIKIKLEFEPAYFLPDDYPTPGKGYTVEQLFGMFLAKKELTPSSRKTFFYHFAVVPDRIKESFAEYLTKEDLKEFENSMREKGLKQTTIFRRINMLRIFLNWSVDEGIIKENPISGYRCKKGENLKLPPPTPGETRAIIENAPKHLKRAVILAYYLGVRPGISELLSLKWEDFDEERKRMRVWSAQKNRSRPWRNIDIVESLFPMMQEWKEEDAKLGAVYIVNYYGKQVKELHRAWRSCKKRAGITRRIRLYDLRHAFATETIAAGADLKAVSDIMGHADTSMIHKHYQHVVDEQKRKVVESVPDILSGIHQRDTKQVLSPHFLYPDKLLLQ